ncbi:TlyA family RNA methyltransferase [Chamaesiphon polymorphus]|uniref:TlyA family rRNA (Cytidine-2'-O)-methyltransferase n=1 Tax=Chamaesiphon polymorphus CCALA 037 TaxID=2107692 RepID=A0A2T1G1Z6_9CYAN|nr:TlyA family RNA methyltransferase [Chamaesiphon polymorphus]PSB51241.1 TlyA family rRNA (cytidine-2'-O)-methyltransferase [Chamaesiphon polymorphus CCALA 037]
MKKQRLDLLLVERNLCESRQLAQRWIQAGEVRVNGEIVDKAGAAILLTATVEVKTKARFVSRGGEKLAKALETFAIATLDRICLDGGISTGGFTDCLLQAGAKQVYGIDVGYGQVDWKLRTDDRVILRERTNIRHLTPAELYGEPVEGVYPVPLPDLGVVDVSFISLNKILPALALLLAPPKELVLLVKPQFEVGKGAIGKNGVVRDLAAQAGAISGVLAAAQGLGWYFRGLTWSPLVGPAGNIEYLLWLNTNGDEPVAVPDASEIRSLTELARQALS